ncbi:MAG: extracellular metalloproteinase, partial [Acidobacteria bacterium]|nr:extracellular metalloproteinase [Acidobacteriota bacterium]
MAEDYLRSVASQYGLGADDVAGLYVARQYRTDHNGVTHVLFKQRFAGIDVFNAAWVVNIDADGSVINAGGRIFHAPAADAVPPDANSANQAVRAAAMEVNPKLAERYLPFQTEAGAGSKGPRFARGGFGADIDSAMGWYAVNGKLRPAWLFRIVDADGIASYATVVDSENQKVLAKQSLTHYQAPPRGLVFERGSPQPNVTPGVLSTTPPPMVQRTLQSFAGDPVASPRGWVNGGQTAGNNAVVGSNPLGYDCTTGLNCLYPPATSVAANGDFSFPLQIGPDAPNPDTFTDAANVNIFYWVNRAHDLFYSIGFDEAAGNFQQQNYGRDGVEGDPMYVYSEFGAASYDGSAELNNSASMSLQPGVDGSRNVILVFLNTARSDSG